MKTAHAATGGDPWGINFDPRKEFAGAAGSIPVDALSEGALRQDTDRGYTSAMHSAEHVKSLAGTPSLETERLTLRGHRVDDFDACTAMWAHPGVTRFITGRPSTPQQTWSRILAYVGHWSLLAFGYWAVEEKASGRFVGELGFADFKRDLTPPEHRGPELGWALAPEFHGRGYATEALRAVVAWSDEHRVWSRTTCLIDPENRASRRVAEKCGYREVVQLTQDDGRSTIVCSRSRS